MDCEKLTLGIDIGTSSIKMSLMNSHTLKSIHSKSIATRANISSDHKKGNEQDAINIIEAMKECLLDSKHLLNQVSIIFLRAKSSNFITYWLIFLIIWK